MTELLLADEASMCALATSVTERNAKPNFLSKPILLRRLERLRLLGRDRIGQRFQVRHQRPTFGWPIGGVVALVALALVRIVVFGPGLTL